MKEVADKIALTAKLLSQKQVLKKVNKNAESMQYQLCNLWDSYQRTINPKSSEKLLEELGKLTKIHSKAQLWELKNAPEGPAEERVESN
jgi:hypothetical protein